MNGTASSIQSPRNSILSSRASTSLSTNRTEQSTNRVSSNNLIYIASLTQKEIIEIERDLCARQLQSRGLHSIHIKKCIQFGLNVHTSPKDLKQHIENLPLSIIPPSHQDGTLPQTFPPRPHPQAHTVTKEDVATHFNALHNNESKTPGNQPSSTRRAVMIEYFKDLSARIKTSSVIPFTKK